MRTRDVFTSTGSQLMEDYTSRLGEAVIRHRAELEVRAARVEAEMSIKARSEFLANMNHELRTPLNAIIGFATMLRDAADYDLGQDQQRTYAEYILQSGDLLLGHINTLLEIAALESGGVTINDDVMDCVAILKQSIERATIQADAAGVKVDLRDCDEKAIAWGDAQRLGEAVDHVLQAAVKSTHKGGRVLARATTRRNGWVEIAVRDNGAGYEEQELGAALDAFTDIHRGLDRSFSGPGIGFAVARTFVEMQGGRFSIKSRPGQGTLVTIEAPPASGKQDAKPHSAGKEQASGENLDMEKSYDAA